MSCTTLSKCILLPISTFFLVIGLAFAAIGVILTSFPGVLLDPVYGVVKDSLDSFLHQGQIALPNSADGLLELPFLHELGTALLVIGLFLFVVSFLAWCGATCTTCCRCLLLVFTALLVVIMLAEIATGSLFLVTDSMLHTNIRTQLKDKITSQFNETSLDSFSSIIIFMSNFFVCCGIDGNADFGEKGHHFCESTVGCYTKLTELIDDNIIWAGLVMAALLLLQLLEAVFAIVIFKGSNKISPI